MEKLKELIDLCKQRQKIFAADEYGMGTLFNTFSVDEDYMNLTRKINRVAKALKIYSISIYDHELSVAFESVSALQKVFEEEPLSKRYSKVTNKFRYSVTLLDGALELFALEDEDKEEHKKAQAI